MNEEKHFVVLGPEGFIKSGEHEDEMKDFAQLRAKAHPGQLYHVLGTIITVKYPIGEAVWNSNFPAEPKDKVAARKLGE